MKDYKLSEIQEICEKRGERCANCPIEDFCQNQVLNTPRFWEINEEEDEENEDEHSR